MMENRLHWWQRPQLRTEGEEDRERKVTWLELFFDLVFVVVVSQLAHILAIKVDWSGLTAFVLLFVPVWWVWIGATYYNDRFETDDVSYRVFTFLQMVPVAALAVFSYDGLGKTSVAFALAYVAARVLLIVMWVRGGLHEAAFRPVATRYAIGFSLSVLLFLLSVAVPPPWRFVLWGIGLLIDVLTPITTLRLQARLPRLAVSKLAERFGLFTIIVLGESVVGVVRGVAAAQELSVATAINFVLGLALAFGLWWVYFDFIARRHARRGVWWSLAWGYLHMPLVMALTATGAGTLALLSLPEPTVPANLRWLIAGSVALTLIVIGLIEVTLRHSAVERANLRTSTGLKFAAGAAALAVGLWGGALGVSGLLLVLIGLVLIQMVHGVSIWFTRSSAEAVEHAASHRPGH